VSGISEQQQNWQLASPAGGEFVDTVIRQFSSRSGNAVRQVSFEHR